ncbi:SDR family NAD(P)-dependent oxidoreductase [Microbacterium sp. GXF7504]
MPTTPLPTASELFSLDGTVAIVTGATSGIGLATARMLASAGARTVLTGLAADDPEGLAGELAASGLPVSGRACDMRSADDIAALVDDTAARFGRIDTLFANAGLSTEDHPIPGLDREAQLDLMLDVHVRGNLRLTDRVLPVMAEGGGGSVVVMSSLAGLRGSRNVPMYGITKAAAAQLARNIAVAWGPRGIRANAIAPGVIETRFAESITKGELREARMQKAPLHRFGRVEEVAGTVLYLASAAGAHTTGQTIAIDGGALISD